MNTFVTRIAVSVLAILLVFCGSAQALEKSYVYDAANRLVQCSYDNGITIEYTYDTQDNRASKSTTGRLTVSAKPLTATTVPNSGGDNTPIARMTLQASADEGVTVTSPAFSVAGSLDDAGDVAAVRLFEDTNANGAVDSGEPQLGGDEAFDADDGTVTFTGLAVAISASGQRDVLLAITLAETAPHGANLQIYIPDRTGVFASGQTSGWDLFPLGVPLSWAVLTSVDLVSPEVAISAPSLSLTNTGPVSYTVTYTGADSITLQPGDVQLVSTGTATGTVGVSGTGTEERTVTISNIIGDGTLGIALAADTARDAAANPADAAGPSATFSVDNTAPSVTVNSLTTSDTTPALTGTIDDGTATIAVTVNAQTNPATNNGDGTWTLPDNTLTTLADGTYNVMVSAADAVGNIANDLSTNELIIDTVAPTLGISAPSAGITTNGPVTYTITYTGADIVTLVNGDVTLNTTGSATGDVAVTGSGMVSRTVTINNISGNGTLGISIVANTASDDASNQAVAAGPSATFNVDNTAIAVNVSAPSLTSTNSGPVNYVVTYDNVTTVSLSTGDITLNSTGDASATMAVGPVTSTSEQTLERQITLSSITGTGMLGISIAAGTATDDLSNPAPAAGPSATFEVDNTAPSVDSIVLSAKKGLMVDYIVTFSEPVTGVDVTDFTLTTTGAVTGAFVVNVSGTGAVYTVTIDTGTGNGTIRLDVIDDDTILDGVGNPLGGPGTGNGDFTAGELYNTDTGTGLLIDWRWCVLVMLLVGWVILKRKPIRRES